MVAPAPAVFSTSRRVGPCDRLERVRHRRRHALHAGGAVAAAARRPGMEADGEGAERRRALELLAQAGGGALVLLLLGARRVEHVGAVDHHVLAGDAELGEGGVEALDARRLDGRLVAVEARRRGEELQGARAGGGGAPRGHVDAAVVDGVDAEEVAAAPARSPARRHSRSRHALAPDRAAAIVAGRYHPPRGRPARHRGVQ